MLSTQTNPTQLDIFGPSPTLWPRFLPCHGTEYQIQAKTNPNYFGQRIKQPQWNVSHKLTIVQKDTFAKKFSFVDLTQKTYIQIRISEFSALNSSEYIEWQFNDGPKIAFAWRGFPYLSHLPELSVISLPFTWNCML